MSGIFGALTERDERAKEIVRISGLLAHRGPDDVGVFNSRRIALGCRLLRTEGEQEAPQPASCASGQIVAVLDGAIFNRRLLQAQLAEQGDPSASRCDAELLARLYEAEGPECICRIRGPFAFAIWDARSSRLLLARDHLGQKPLFYADTPHGFYFASEIGALSSALQITPEIDLQSLDRYLSMRFVPGEGTMLRGVRKLPPAHRLVHDGNGPSISRYWQLSFARKLQLSHDDSIDGLEQKLRETVAAHLASGGTGAFLSGGLDSSLIVAMMAGESDRPVPTFSIGFAEKEFDEIPHARVVSEHFGTQQHEGRADTDLIRSLPAIIQGLGEPSDPVAASFFTASRLAAGHVKVALGGDGGNELFAGCDRYRGVTLSRYYALLPAPLRRALLAPLVTRIPAGFGYDSLQLKLRWFERMASIRGVGERLAEAVAFFRFSEEEKRLLLADGVRRQLDPGSAAREISERYEESDAADPVERMLYADYCTRLPEHLLMLVDRMGMASSLEVRSPLVDRELVEYMAQLPLRMKLRGGKSRYIWYKLAERQLPASIARRKKRGFRFPLAAWFAGELYPFLRRLFEQSELAQDDVVRREYLLRLLEEHRARKVDHNWKLWMLLNLELWYRMSVKGSDLPTTERWIARLAAER